MLFLRRQPSGRARTLDKDERRGLRPPIGRGGGHRWYRRAAVIAAASGALLCIAPAAGAASTVVTLEFDHAAVGQYALRPVLKEHGMHATFYVSSGKIGQPSYLSWTQLAGLYSDGNEIGGHTVTHAPPAGLTPDEQRLEVCQDRANLLRAGFAVSTFSYPFGSTAISQALVQGCGYNSGRGYRGLRSNQCPTCPTSETIPPVEPYRTLTTEGIAEADPQSTLQRYVTQAEQNGGGWVQIVFPYNCPTCLTSPAVLDRFLDWLAPRAAQGTVVRTAQQVTGGRLQPVPFGFGDVRLPTPRPDSGLLPATADTLRPLIVRLSLSRKRFAVGPKPTAVRARTGRGTTIRYILSEPAGVRLRIQRGLPGRRAGSRCRGTTRRLLSAPRCTRYHNVGSLLRKPGRVSQRVRFSGRIRRRALRPGLYRIVATASDLAGNRSKKKTARFRVLAR